ncbi:hypothetical protein F2Q68_00005001 [Brassica cretica]|uniref:Uncharacterized protein n=1 Tax=Brassica cretica TaxID=69181 RepID=A0A8S9JP81_BRACR|nr:hypothetical protein F2Q68_00005001 [Brassica cretica]
MTPTESTPSCNAVRILTHEEFAAKHPRPPNPDNVRNARLYITPIDRQQDVDIDRQPPVPIDRRAHITYRVQMPKIDVARLNALRPKPKPLENPPDPVRTPSDDGEDPMEEDREEKLQAVDFKVESLMSFGRSHWCRSTPDFEHRSTSPNPNRSTGSPEHRPMTPTESTASCNAVRILTHEEFAAKHPHPPNPDNVRITRRNDTAIDRQTEAAIDRHTPAPIDR